MPGMLVICDFDGTVTQFDTLNHLATRFAPEVFARVEGRLVSGELSLREVLAAELGGMVVGHDEVVRAAVEEVPLRAGFAEFVAGVREAGHRLVLVSAGFRQLIEPMLANAGLDADVELVANDVEFTDRGGVVTFRDSPTCGVCGEQCKRAEVDLMRRPGETVAYIGDGFSDRCGATAADIVFARAGLASYLDGRGVAYTWFDDFVEVGTALEQRCE